MKNYQRALEAIEKVCNDLGLPIPHDINIYATGPDYITVSGVYGVQSLELPDVPWDPGFHPAILGLRRLTGGVYVSLQALPAEGVAA